MENEISVTLERRDAFAFTVRFDGTGLPAVVMDEAEPLGGGKGPNATRQVAAAVGHCLSASLLFCLQKARVDVAELTTKVVGSLARNERGRWRIAELQVTIAPSVADAAAMDRCLGLFEDFCIVTESIRQGIPVRVAVQPDASGDG